MLLLLAPTLWLKLPAATVGFAPQADALLWSAAPTNNYGGAGAISVSGSAAVNGSNEQNGLFDSLIRFPMSNVVSSLDASLGTHDWLVLSATIHLTEIGTPPSPIFNRGVGRYEIRWIGTNDWTEGTGIPIDPTSDGVTWNDLPSLLNPGTDMSLGQFTNSGIDGGLVCRLTLEAPFLSDIHAGTPGAFYLTAADPQIGFTAASRSNVVSNNVPMLDIEAAVNPHPQIDSIQLLSTNVLISFGMSSNWNYALQGSAALAEAGPGSWSNLLTLPTQPAASNVVFLEAITSGQKFYRLVASP